SPPPPSLPPPPSPSFPLYVSGCRICEQTDNNNDGTFTEDSDCAGTLDSQDGAHIDAACVEVQCADAAEFDSGSGTICTTLTDGSLCPSAVNGVAESCESACKAACESHVLCTGYEFMDGSQANQDSTWCQLFNVQVYEKSCAPSNLPGGDPSVTAYRCAAGDVDLCELHETAPTSNGKAYCDSWCDACDDAPNLCYLSCPEDSPPPSPPPPLPSPPSPLPSPPFAFQAAVAGGCRACENGAAAGTTTNHGPTTCLHHAVQADGDDTSHDDYAKSADRNGGSDDDYGVAVEATNAQCAAACESRMYFQPGNVWNHPDYDSNSCDNNGAGGGLNSFCIVYSKTGSGECTDADCMSPNDPSRPRSQPVDGDVCYGYELKLSSESGCDTDVDCPSYCELWTVPWAWTQDSDTTTAFSVKYNCVLSSYAEGFVSRRRLENSFEIVHLQTNATLATDADEHARYLEAVAEFGEPRYGESGLSAYEG
ncbi:MAG: hypothetical protein ACKVI4_17965, partial [Actinomycetales bacterium]